jgi:hypothetical protein
VDGGHEVTQAANRVVGRMRAVALAGTAATGIAKSGWCVRIADRPTNRVRLMNNKTVITMKLPNLRCAILLVVVCLSMCANWASLASAELVTFSFEGVLLQDPGPTLPIPVGQRVHGYYTFELNTPATPFPNAAVYSNALSNFVVKLDGIGTGSSNSGDIRLGNPTQYSGSSNFFADDYTVHGPVAGIVIPTASGDRTLVAASLRLKDLDQVGLDAVDLSATPPNLVPFLDHTGPTFASDNAEIFLNFLYPDGNVYSPSFRLTSLTAVPEPTAVLLVFAGIPAVHFRYRKRTFNPVRHSANLVTQRA